MPGESGTPPPGARRKSRIGTGRGRTRFSGSTEPKESRPGRSAAPLRRIGPRTPQASWPRAVGRTARRSSGTTAGTRELGRSNPSRRGSVRRAILSRRSRYKGTGERMPRLRSSYGKKLSSVTARVAQAVERTPLRRADSLHAPTSEGARWPPYAPFCSDGIGLSVLPGAKRLLGLAPMGCRRLTRSHVNVTAERIILDAGCVVSAPLPALSDPPLARGHRSWGGGTFLSNPGGSPSAVRGLLAVRAHPRARIWICWRCRRFDALLRTHRSRRTRDLCDSTERGLTI